MARKQTAKRQFENQLAEDLNNHIGYVDSTIVRMNTQFAKLFVLHSDGEVTNPDKSDIEDVYAEEKQKLLDAVNALTVPS